MKISITKKQYGALVDLVYLADWILHAHDVDDRAETQQYRELTQVLLSKAKEAQAEDLVESFKDRLYPSRIVEERMQAVIDTYDETSMWEELISALALRDARHAVGEKVLHHLPGEERLEVLCKHEEPWAKEFEENGVSRLVVSERSS
jgi:hypothetical protein